MYVQLLNVYFDISSSINIKEVKHKFDGRISLIQKDIRVSNFDEASDL